ncbi:hypothetical protein F5Y11DRAFT_356292 [Daldinia sp. FL1419]|nr:hypothetical protein F5Y11DRAFT_356292 [Daldinia sp. FL1419]
MSVQDLARSLAAVGSVKLPGDESEGIYVLSVRDGDLVEKYWVGDLVENENIIASGVRNDTSASYLLGSEEKPRLVIFIDQYNSLRCYAYDEAIEDWEETPLGDKWNITTSPTSKISAINQGEEMVVSYQDNTGCLAVLRSVGDTEWTSSGPLGGNPIPGTPQCLEVIGDKLHLFYIEKDLGIGYLVFDPRTGSWKADILDNTKFGTTIDNFSVAEDPETNSLQSYFLTDGSLWSVNGEKEKTLLGRVEEDGNLIPSVKAQAGWRVSWKGARKTILAERRQILYYPAMGNDMQQEFGNLNLNNFKLPTRYFHSARRNNSRYEPERFGIGLSTPARRWEDWVVKLSFEKLGSEKHGNGFYVNVPNATYDVILTAGHNLVDGPQHYCSNIKIVNDPLEEIVKDPLDEKDILVNPDMIRVSSKYFEDPGELNAAFDYGVILIERQTLKRHRGFGFHIMLGPASQLSTECENKDVLQDRMVYVCGYTPKDSPLENQPRRSEGKCVAANKFQLRYDADTEQGMSGGPVWIGFRGVETVVAIHTYGEEDDGSGNKGTRLNLDVWRDIFSWCRVGWFGKSLYCCKPSEFTMHLHLPDDEFSEGRVRVGKPGRAKTLFDVIPVAAKPGGRESDASYAFISRAPGINVKDVWPKGVPHRWVRWDSRRNQVSGSKVLDARCEVKIPRLAHLPNKPFEVQIPEGNDWKHLRMGMEYLDEGDLELLREDPQISEDTSEVSYGPITRTKGEFGFNRMLRITKVSVHPYFPTS